MSEDRIAADFRDGIGPLTEEIFGEDNPQNRRKVYRQFELPPAQRLKGIFKLSERRVACVPSIVGADLARRAGQNLTADND
jgi:hypothetical protein